MATRSLLVGLVLLVATSCGRAQSDHDQSMMVGRWFPGTSVVECRGSEMPLNLKIVPGPKSQIPGYEDQVEQCGEFVYRYFVTYGLRYPAHYPTVGQPAEY